MSDWPHENVLPERDLEHAADQLVALGFLLPNEGGLTRAGKVAALVLASYMGTAMLAELARVATLTEREARP